MSFAWPLIAVAAGMVLISSTPSEPDRQSSYQKARKLALQYLRKVPKGSVVIFDFDYTLFDPGIVIDQEFTGVRRIWNGDRRAIPIYKPITEIIDILQVAASMGHYVVLITARTDSAQTRAVVNANFRRRGMHYNLFFGAHENSTPTFKAELRKKLAERYNVVLTIGDQWGDVRAPGQAAWLKLPDRHDLALYSSL